MDVKVGEFVKVWLPGETPWAEVIASGPGIFKGRIANKLFNEYSEEEQRQFTGQHFGTAAPLPRLHSHKEGDELWFEPGDMNTWVPLSNHRDQ